MESFWMRLSKGVFGIWQMPLLDNTSNYIWLTSLVWLWVCHPQKRMIHIEGQIKDKSKVLFFYFFPQVFLQIPHLSCGYALNCSEAFVWRGENCWVWSMKDRFSTWGRAVWAFIYFHIPFFPSILFKRSFLITTVTDLRHRLQWLVTDKCWWIDGIT